MALYPPGSSPQLSPDGLLDTVTCGGRRGDCITTWSKVQLLINVIGHAPGMLNNFVPQHQQAFLESGGDREPCNLDNLTQDLFSFLIQTNGACTHSHSPTTKCMTRCNTKNCARQGALNRTITDQ